MEDESHRDNLGAHLNCEDAHEDWLQLLQLERQDGLVFVGDPGVHGHDDAVGHDGDDDQPFKGRPGDKPDKKASENKTHESRSLMTRFIYLSLEFSNLNIISF